MSIENRQAKAEKNLQTLRGMADAIQTGTFTDPAKKYVIDATSLDTHIAGVTKQTTFRETILEKGIPRLESRISKLASDAQRISEARKKILSIKNAPAALVDQLKARFEADFGESFDPSTPKVEVHESTPAVKKSETPSPIINIPTPEEKHDNTPSEPKIIPDTVPTSGEARKKTVRVSVNILGETYEVAERTAQAITLILANRDISNEELAEEMNISVAAARASRSWAIEYIQGVERLQEKTEPEEKSDTAPEEKQPTIEPNEKLPAWLRGKKTENPTGLKFWETPLFDNQISALKTLLSDASRDDVVQAMGNMRNGRPFTRSTVNRSLTTALAKLKQRIEKDVASEEEKNIWDGFSEQLPESHAFTDVYSHVRTKLSEKMGFLHTTSTDDTTQAVNPEPPKPEITSMAIPEVKPEPKPVVQAKKPIDPEENTATFTRTARVTQPQRVPEMTMAVPKTAPVEAIIKFPTPEVAHVVEKDVDPKLLTAKEVARLAIITKNLHGVSLDFGSEKTTFNIPEDIQEVCKELLAGYKNGDSEDMRDPEKIATALIHKLHDAFTMDDKDQITFITQHPEAAQKVLEWFRTEQGYVFDLLESTIQLNPVIAKQLLVSSAERTISLDKSVQSKIPQKIEVFPISEPITEINSEHIKEPEEVISPAVVEVAELPISKDITDILATEEAPITVSIDTVSILIALANGTDTKDLIKNHQPREILKEIASFMGKLSMRFERGESIDAAEEELWHALANSIPNPESANGTKIFAEIMSIARKEFLPKMPQTTEPQPPMAEEITAQPEPTVQTEPILHQATISEDDILTVLAYFEGADSESNAAFVDQTVLLLKSKSPDSLTADERYVLEIIQAYEAEADLNQTQEETKKTPLPERARRKKRTIEDNFHGIGEVISEQVSRVLITNQEKFSPVQLRTLFRFSVQDSKMYVQNDLVKPERGKDHHPSFTPIEAATVLTIKKIGSDKVNKQTAEAIAEIVKKELEKQQKERKDTQAN